MELHCKTLGRGKKSLLAFHGVSQTGGECFEVFEKALGEVYTIYAFDLPFHGQSSHFFDEERWDRGDEPISPAEFRDFLHLFLESHRIDHFSVVGFSLGGRFALVTLAQFHERIDFGYLIAPDGVREQVVYRLATGTRLMRRVFLRVMSNAHVLYGFATLLQKAGLMHTSVLKVLKYMTGTRHRTRIVYYSWVNFRKLKMEPTGLPDNLTGRESKVFVLTGKYDHLIKDVDVEVLTRTLAPQNWIRLNAGHISTVEVAAAEIRKIERSEV